MGLLVGCATVDLAPAETREISARQLGIDPSSIVVQTPARFALITAGAQYPDFTSGVYTQTKATIELSTYESKEKTFSRVRSVDLREVKRFMIISIGLFHIQQLQLVVGDKLLVLDCTNDPNSDGGGSEKTKPVIDGLIAAGIAHDDVTSLTRSALWVMPSEMKFMTVPIIRK